MPDIVEDIELRRRFEDHLDVYRAHEQDHVKREERLLKEQENTSRNIAELTKAIMMETRSTKPIIRLWDAWDTFRKMVIWISGFSGAAVTIAWSLGFIKLGGGP